MNTHQVHVRDGHSCVRPYLCGPLSLPEFLTKVFDAKLVIQHDFDSSRRHVEMAIGDSIVVIEAGEFPAGATPWTGCVYVYVPDADAVHAKALALGAREKAPVEDKDYQERQGGFIDAGGNTWWVSTFTG